MRITGGKIKGRQLSTLKGLSIRPTSDRVREAIFDLIGQHWEGKQVLDLFAGTGSLGLEALSRGADKALFVDYAPHALRLLQKNIERCAFGHCSKIVRKDLRKIGPGKDPFGRELFHLLFMDPPYRKNLITNHAERLIQSTPLSPGALLIAECARSEIPPTTVGPFEINDTRIYGDTRVTIYLNEVDET
jgi:16S rRNA (guanine966-N2)-methyltransferase